MNGIVDFHCHILPGIDDGSKSVEMSVAMLQKEAEQGIRQVIATPHFYANYDHPQRFLERRNAAEARLREEMEKHSDLPQLSVGAEVYFFPGMSSSDWLSALTMSQKKCMLIEMPESAWTENNYRELGRIYENCGIIPVVAHVERCISLFRNRDLLRRLGELPVLVQANASFFLNPRTRHTAMKMLRKEQIHLLGSDCHNLTERRPNLGPALELIRGHLGDGAVEWIRKYQEMI